MIDVQTVEFHTPSLEGKFDEKVKLPTQNCKSVTLKGSFITRLCEHIGLVPFGPDRKNDDPSIGNLAPKMM